MPSISRINAQLEGLGKALDNLIHKLGSCNREAMESLALSVERLARAQKALLESQVLIFIEATESDLDMPTLPLFVEEREPEEPEGMTPALEEEIEGHIARLDGEPEPRCETCGPPGPKECVDRNPVWCPPGEPERKEGPLCYARTEGCPEAPCPHIPGSTACNENRG